MKTKKAMLSSLILATMLANHCSASSLAGVLSKGIFYHNGTVHSTDVFELVEMSVSYNEPDNVSCSMCGWAVHSGWTYPWQRVNKSNSTIPTSSRDGGTCQITGEVNNTDHPECDLGGAVSPTFEDCQARCCNNSACVGFLFEEHSDSKEYGCTLGQGCCWLKNCNGKSAQKSPSVGARYASITGRSPVPPPPGPDPQPTVDEVQAPPFGYRSSPALGGVSTGSTELRSDGSFRDWTIFNQGPAGSGKYGLVDDVYMAVKVGDAAKMIRTTPPQFTSASSGVDSLTFSGTYPLTRLQISDTTIPGTPTIHGYSTLKPTSLKESAYPALALTFTYTNPTSSAQDISFMLSVPFGGWTDCARPGGTPITGITSYADCLHVCSKAANCSAWEFDTSSSTCSVSTTTPYTMHKVGSYCGVRSAAGWEKSASGNGLFRSQRPDASGPSMGDMTIQPVSASGATMSFGASDDPNTLWNQFAASGSFNTPLGDVAHGAAAVSMSAAAGETVTLSIVLAWHFPDRDFSHQILGNMYTTFWKDSSAVADELATEERLTDVVTDIILHHSVIAHPDNPSPVWLKDQLVNQWSHYHMLMWYKDGRLREYEAWSCDDVDSVHNDYQRHLLYLWAYPEFEFNKMEAWSTFAQDKTDGHIMESLGYTGRPMDSAGGRYMGDTTTLYLLEMYELMLHTGNVSYVKSLWPSAKLAVGWMMNNAGNFSLPQHITTTYDHFGFEHHQTVVYNCHVYLTALKAMMEMAKTIGDLQTQQNVTMAYNAAIKKLLTPAPSGPLWDDDKKFFRAHSDTTTQVFTDSLYGQMLSHHFFNGTYTVDAAYLTQHLAYEWEQNQDLYGMRVLSNPIQEDSIWMNGPPTWTYLSLALGNVSEDAAWEPFKRMSENFRTRLHDMWNLRALTHSQTEGTELEHGQPREQGHYGFMLTDLYLIPLLSGQNVNLVDGVLSLAPRYNPPYVLPILIMNCEASLTAAIIGTKTQYTVSQAFGTLQLPAGGLTVHGCAYSQAVSLSAGDNITWTC